MKRLLLIFYFTFVSYGCEKIEPKVLLSYEYSSDHMSEYLKASKVVRSLKDQATTSDFFNINKWFVLDESVEGIETVNNVILDMKEHDDYYKKAIEHNEINTANYAYNKYMYLLQYQIEGIEHPKHLDLMLQALDRLEENPTFRVIARSNLNRALELWKSIERNYDANLRVN